MLEIVTQLIAASIDANKIPGLDCFDMSARKNGKIAIRLESGEVIYITINIAETESK